MSASVIVFQIGVSMKVLHLLPSLNLFGGTPKKTAELIQYSNNNHLVFCWSMWEGREEYLRFKSDFERKGIQVIDCFDELKKPSVIKLLQAICKLVKDQNVDVIHSYFGGGQVLGALAKLRYPKIKLVTAFVGVSCEKNYVRWTATSLALLAHSKIIFISNYVKKSQLKNYPLLRFGDCQIIYNGTSRRFSLRSKIKMPDAFNLVTVSGLNAYKNVAILIDMLNVIKQQNQINSIVLHIVGDGPLRKNLELKVDEYMLQDSVVFHGYQDDVGGILQQCQVYLHPSDKEGFGIAVIEAMRAGLPVVVSDAGALPEVVLDGESGVLARPYCATSWAEAVIRLMQEKRIRREIAVKGYLRAKAVFSVQRFAKDHDVLYENVK